MASDRSYDDFLKMKKVIDSKGEIEVKIISDSMMPLIQVDEVIRVKKITENPSIFDIIVFFREKKFVAHFVWRYNGLSHKTITTRSLKEKGVNEFPVELNDILGVVQGKKISFFTKAILRIFYGD
jgi:signal peptidase